MKKKEEFTQKEYTSEENLTKSEFSDKEQLAETESTLENEVVETVEAEIINENPNVETLATREESNKKSNSDKKRKVIIGCGISIIGLIVIYLGTSLYFINHFYFGSIINGINVTGKSVETATEEITLKNESHVLELVGRDGIKDSISASDISLEYKLGNEISTFKENQNHFNWISGLFKKDSLEFKGDISYDENKLKDVVSNLAYFTDDGVIAPKDATLEYKDNEYVVIKEVLGNTVIKDILYENIVQAILDGKDILNLEEINCYVPPKYTSTSNEILNAKDVLNKYVSTKIIYTLGESEKVVDASVINTWLELDENIIPTINEEKISEHVQELATSINTYKINRNFKTSLGTTVQVNGGDYGWIVNKGEEAKEIMSNLQEGGNISREPIYSQRANSYGDNDIGNTYVEVNIEKQHIWFYKDGNLITEGDITSGNISQNTGTRLGTFALKYKQRDKVLRGVDYAVPVAFWMPFDGGIGLHDADWRSYFGGEIYKTNGSHGCVNMPYAVAKDIFDNISAGTPVICY